MQAQDLEGMKALVSRTTNHSLQLGFGCPRAPRPPCVRAVRVGCVDWTWTTCGRIRVAARGPWLVRGARDGSGGRSAGDIVRGRCVGWARAASVLPWQRPLLRQTAANGKAEKPDTSAAKRRIVVY